MTFNVIIPARYASTRLPGKVLLDIAGKPMLQHVYERAMQSGATQVIIATDDERVKKVAEDFGAQVCVTANTHTSGTERLAEVVETLNYSDDAIVVNVQGDEPLISPKLIAQTATDLAKHLEADAATLCERIYDHADLNDPNVVKVVRDANSYALYFSRAPIAWDRNANSHQQTHFSAFAEYYRHIGLYAYRVRTIKQYVARPACYLERMEALEQLRVLWYGGKIFVALAERAITIGVDTQADLEKVINYLKDN